MNPGGRGFSEQRLHHCTLAWGTKQNSVSEKKKERKKMWYTHTMGYYSAIKKNEILSLATTQVELEIIMLSEISQFSFVCGI